MNKITRPLSITLSLLALGLASVSWAAEPTPVKHGQHAFASFDTDKNGFISEQEFDAAKALHHQQRPKKPNKPLRITAPTFASFDANKDGQLSQEELQAGQEAHHKAMQAKPHCKCDEKKHNAPNFEHFDLNKDGAISETEFTETRNQHRAEREKAGKKVPDLSKLPTFADIDTDHNGSLSKEELAAHHKEHHHGH